MVILEGKSIEIAGSPISDAADVHKRSVCQWGQRPDLGRGTQNPLEAPVTGGVISWVL